MKEVVIYCRHPRFESWMAAIIKRLPVHEGEIRFANDQDSLEKTLNNTQALVLLDYKWAASLEELLASAVAQIILMGDVQNAQAPDVWQMRQLCLERPQIHAFLDYSRDAEFYLPVLRSALLARDGADKMDEVRQLTIKLNSLVSQNLGELHRLKRLHERLVPLRAEKLKGVSIHSKFAAGESAGGEFFDTVSREREMLILMASSRSYVASSAILGHFEDLRSKNSFSSEVIEQFISALSYELKKLQVQEVELMLLNLDLNTMQLKGYNFGAATVWKKDKQLNRTNDLEVNPTFVEKARMEVSLKRGERLLVRSSGLAKNLEGTSLASSERWQEFLTTQNSRSVYEMMGEIFFQLKKDTTSDFLKTDASAIIIEVDQNAILQV